MKTLLLPPLFILATATCSLATEDAKLLAPNGGSLDRFGQAVAMTDDFLIVGAHREDTGGSNAGSVYVYRRSDQSYLRTLNASDSGSNHLFGWSLAAEGNQLLVGAPGNDSGAAYLFDLSNGAELQKLLPTDPSSGDQFGHSVALSSTHALVGAWLEDENDLNPSEDSGAAYLFDTGTFQQLHRLQAADTLPADQFGGSVALTDSFACVGALFDDHSGSADAGSVTIFDISTGNEARTITADTPAEGDVFGTAMAAKGNLLVVGAPEADAQGTSSGAAYLFEISSGTQLADLTPSGGGGGHRLGTSVAMAETIVAGAFRAPASGLNDAGVAHTFSLAGDYQSTLQASDAAGSDFFGHSVATIGSQALVGSVQDDDQGSSSGSAYLFTFSTISLLEDLAIQVSGMDIQLSWLATPDATYQIFTTTDLSNWPTQPSSTFSPTSTTALFTDVGGINGDRKFYRVVAE